MDEQTWNLMKEAFCELKKKYKTMPDADYWAQIKSAQHYIQQIFHKVSEDKFQFLRHMSFWILKKIRERNLLTQTFEDYCQDNSRLRTKASQNYFDSADSMRGKYEGYVVN